MAREDKNIEYIDIKREVKSYEKNETGGYTFFMDWKLSDGRWLSDVTKLEDNQRLNLVVP